MLPDSRVGTNHSPLIEVTDKTESGPIDSPTINQVTALAQTASKFRPEPTPNSLTKHISDKIHPSLHLLSISICQEDLNILVRKYLYYIQNPHSTRLPHQLLPHEYPTTDDHILASTHSIQPHQYFTLQATNVALAECFMKSSGLCLIGEWAKYLARSIIVFLLRNLTRPESGSTICGSLMSSYFSHSVTGSRTTPVHSYTGTSCGTTNLTVTTGCILYNRHSFLASRARL